MLTLPSDTPHIFLKDSGTPTIRIRFAVFIDVVTLTNFVGICLTWRKTIAFNIVRIKWLR